MELGWPRVFVKKTIIPRRWTVKKADALGDKLYILCGTIIEHNLQDKIEDIFNEIHRSNMSKLDSNGNPVFREDGKIIKGENYFPPNLKDLI